MDSAPTLTYWIHDGISRFGRGLELVAQIKDEPLDIGIRIRTMPDSEIIRLNGCAPFT